MSTSAPIDVNLLGNPTSTSFAISPDYPALIIIVILMVLTVITIILTLYHFTRTPWTPSPPSTSPPSYKLRALSDGLALLHLPPEKTITSTVPITNGIQPLPDSRPPPDSPRRPNSLPSLTPDPLLPILTPTPPPPLTDATPDIYLHELSATPSTASLEHFDLTSAAQILTDTRTLLHSSLSLQSFSFSAFTSTVHAQLDTIKQLLAVKLSVTLNKQQAGFLESIDRLVSGEVLARQSTKDLHRRMEESIGREVEELVQALRNLSDTYDIFPIKHLIKNIGQQVDRLELLHREERGRRKAMGAFTPVVGRRIVEALVELDGVEEGLIDGYLSALLFFQASSTEILHRLMVEEANHASTMEKLDESNVTRRDYEMDRYHLGVMKVLRDLQTQLGYLDEKLGPVVMGMRRAEENAVLVWGYVQGPLLEGRWDEVEKAGKGSGGLWRGVNSELAKVLSGLLGMRGGMEWVGGKWRERGGVDRVDPFDAVFDPGFLEDRMGKGEASKEEVSDKRKSQGKDKAKDNDKRSKSQERLSKTDKSKPLALSTPTSPSPLTTPVTSSTTELTPLPVPPPSLLTPVTASHSLLLSDLLHRRAMIVRDGQMTAEQRAVALKGVEDEMDELMEEWGGEVVEVLSGWRAAKEMGTPQLIQHRWQECEDELMAVVEEVRRASVRHANEREALEAELLMEGEEEQRRYREEPSYLTALIERAKGGERRDETKEEKEVRALVERGVTDPAEIAKLLMEQHDKQRQQRMASLLQRQQAELTQLDQRQRQLTQARDDEALLKQRLSDVHDNDVAMQKRDEEEQSDEGPETVEVSWKGKDGQPQVSRILRTDRGKLATVDEEDEEKMQENEKVREREMNELQSRQGKFADLSDEEWQSRVADLQAQHAAQRQAEQAAHQQRVQQLTEELTAQCLKQLTEYEQGVAEHQRQLRAEEKEREAALLKEWAKQPGGQPLGPLVSSLMRGRHQHELEQLMAQLDADRAALLTQQIQQLRQANQPIDIPTLQHSIRQSTLPAQHAALLQLQAQHQLDLTSAYQQCGGQGDPPSLNYTEVEGRARVIAEGMDRAQEELREEVEERTRRIMADEKMSDEEKASAIRGLLDGLSSFDERVAREKQKQQGEMEKKMEERRRKKKEEQERKAKEKAGQTDKDELMQAALRAQQQLSTPLPQAAPVPASAPSVAAPVSQATDPSTAEKLNRIEQLVQSLHADATRWRESAYTDESDVKDPRFLSNTQLTLVPLTSLTPSQSFLHRFTQSLIHLIHSLHPIPHPSSSPSPPSLLIASELPPPRHFCCAYRHVMTYDELRHGLVVRVERMEEVGRFINVVLHGAAHIQTEGEVRRDVRKRAMKDMRQRAQREVKADEKEEEEERLRWVKEEASEVERCWDDRDARFQRHLHRLQSVVMADFVFNSTVHKPAWLSMLPDVEAKDEPSTMSEAANRVATSSLLSHPPASSLPASSPALYSHLPSFSTSRILSRLSRYTAFTQHSNLVQYLHDLERSLHTHQRSLPSLPSRVASITGRAQVSEERWGVDGEGEVEGWSEVEDELNGRLSELMEVWWRVKAEVERDERQAEGKEGKEKEELDRVLREKRWRMGELIKEKDELIMRLRTCQQAQNELKHTQAVAVEG